MIKYIHYFESDNAFLKEYYTSAYTEPWVSYTEETVKINYNRKNDTDTHEYIEIAGLRWATMNVGATAVTDYGKYFQWGDISGYTASQIGTSAGKKAFNFSDYLYNDSGDNNPRESNMTKYNRTDGLVTLEFSDDGVHTEWGGAWRMPSKEEFEALLNATTSAWTNNYKSTGIHGLVLVDKVDSSKELFFPAAGMVQPNGSIYTGNYACCWTSTIQPIDVRSARRFVGSYENKVEIHDSQRRLGMPLRGVKEIIN